MYAKLEDFIKADDAKYCDLNLLQWDIGGGEIAKEQIDVIREHPEAESIIISGLRQDTFDYFIHTYGKQFRVIIFWKNKAVKDWSALSELEDLEYMRWYWNLKIDVLWDMSRNDKLRGLEILSFKKLHSIAGIEKAKNLEYFSIGDAVWADMEIETLDPILNSNITHFSWWGKKLLDGNYMCLSKSKIQTLDMSPGIFTMDELARLIAAFPETLQGSCIQPYTKGTIRQNGEIETFYFLCKNKRKCKEGIDDARFEKYLREFNALVRKYRLK